MSIIERPSPSGSQHDPAPPTASPPVADFAYERLIQPSQGWIAVDWKELYQSRELLDTLVSRDLRIRYKQTVLGVAWAVLQPLATMMVFTVIFANFAGIKPPGIPYPLFVLAALVPWTFFANSVTTAGISLLTQQQLLTKIYFPRLFIPMSTIGTHLVDMAIGLSLFFLFMPLYRHSPSINLIFLPFIIALTAGAALGLGLVLSSVTVLYRDLRYIIPFMIQLLMFISPIFWQTSVLPQKLQLLVAINPLAGIISAYRWSILGLPLDGVALAISTVSTIVILIFGLYFFRKSERYFADIL